MSIRDIAIKATTLSPLMVGKNKLETDEIIRKYPNGVSIIAFDIVKNGKGEEYGIYLIDEEHTVFCNAGKVLTGIFNELATEFQGIEEANTELSKEPLKIKLEKGKTKDGNTITNVTVL